MHLPEIASLYDDKGPFVSLYLYLGVRAGNAGARIQAEWRLLRSRLSAAGADEETLTVLADRVAGSAPGDRTLAAFASRGQPRLARDLGGPMDSLAYPGALPFGIPLIARLQEAVPHVVALVDRTGADLAAHPAGQQPSRSEQVRGSQDEIERNAPGGWSQPRYQHRAEDSWERNAAEVAAALATEADKVDAELIVLAGDVRAVQYLREHLPSRLRPLIYMLPHGGRHPDGSAALRAAEIERQVRSTAAASTARVLDRFRAERGQHDRAADGVQATISALADGRVATLLVPDDSADERTGWFGPRPNLLTTHQRTLLDQGVIPTAGRLLDILVRAALGTSADVHVIPVDTRDGPADGVGALLRYP